jgi:dethiobiotin synthetase
MNIFITGTDTGVGKTYVSEKLLQQYKNQGLKTIGLKPIASGCETINGKLYNQDALILQNAATIKLDYDLVNPFAFEPPIAPHIAAGLNNTSLTIENLCKKIKPALDVPADIRIIEGAGGWLLPLNTQETMADFVIQQNFAVILVVGMRLGCINHALLTARAMQAANVNCIGWIANCMEPNMPYLSENIETLTKCLPMALL